MQNKPQILMLLVSIVFFVATVAAVWFFYSLTEKKHLEIEQAQLAWHTKEERRTEIKQLERILEDIKTERAELDSHFAPSLDVVPLLDNLEKMGDVVSAKAEVSSVDRIEEGKSLLVGIKATGSWNALYKFIVLLEHSPYELAFTSLDIKKSFSEGETVMWEGFFKIKVLSFLP